jgi:hypothetical protein
MQFIEHDNAELANLPVLDGHIHKGFRLLQGVDSDVDIRPCSLCSASNKEPSKSNAALNVVRFK